MQRQVFLALACAAVITAAPFSVTSVSTLTAIEVASFRPYALFARAAFCSASSIATWSCGVACSDIPGFVPFASGGDGVATPFWFVGFDPSLQSVIVSNQGREASELAQVLVSTETKLEVLDSRLFPGISSSVQVIGEFREVQAQIIEEKFVAIQRVMVERQVSLVTFTGLGSGGAISLIDALYVSTNLPSARLKVVTHGIPRFGNQEFVELVETRIVELTRINNRNDFIPALPSQSLGFSQTSGERHIVAPGNWVNCVGRDNADRQCTVGTVSNVPLGGNVTDSSAGRNTTEALVGRTVSNVLVGGLADHLGPYENILIGGCP